MTLSKEIRDCPNQGHRLNALLEKTAHFGAKKLWNGPQKNFVAPAHILNVFFCKKKRTQIGPL